MKRVVIALLAVAVIAVGAGVALSGDSSPAEGPLDTGTLDLAYGMEVGEEHSMGIIKLANTGDEPAVVEQVRLIGVRGPIELIGVKTRLFPADGPAFGALEGFPPTEYPAAPLAEKNVVPVPTEFTEAGGPLERLQLVIGVRMTAPGTAAARGAEVTYRVGDKEYRKVFEHRLWFCSPPAEYFGEGKGCPPKGQEDDFGDGVLG